MSVAVVFGASRGLGLLVAADLLGRGHRTVITARDQTELDAAVDQLARDQDPTMISSMVCDVGNRDQVGEVIRRIEDEVGPIEVCLTVAGVIQVAPAESLTFEHFDQAISTMLYGPINIAWQVLPSMRERGRGRIGTITSVGGVVSPPHLLPYSTAKFGALGFSDGLAASLAGTGITATTIVPGLMRTGSHLRAEFAGDVGKEYAWFAPAASVPGLAMDAERAATKIVQAVLDGKPWLSLTPLTWAATRFRGAAPATTTRLMGVVNRLLPDGDSDETVQGFQARESLRPGSVARRVVDGLSTLGNRAARRNNEHPQHRDQPRHAHRPPHPEPGHHPEPPAH